MPSTLSKAKWLQNSVGKLGKPVAKRTFDDLAIAGGSPAFDQPLHVGRPNLPDREAFFRLAEEIFDRRWLSNRGPVLLEFEDALSRHLQVEHVVAVCNATVGIEVLLRVLGLKGEVIVPAFTFVATAHAVEWMGLKPVFADVEIGNHNLDLAHALELITSDTVALMPVHLWGEPCRPGEFQELARRKGLKLLFDAAHAFSCHSEGTPIGGFGDAEVFSFHATKTFNSFEGGAITTNDSKLVQELRLAINFGFSGVDQVSTVGTNAKMTEICAAMGLCQLKTIEKTIETNRLHQQTYADVLNPVSGIEFRRDTSAERRNYQYCVAEVMEHRDQLLKVLHAENVLARRYFYPGVHRMKPYCDRNPSLSLPNTEAIASRVLVLPTGTSMSTENVADVANLIRVALSDPDRLAAIP